MGLLFLTLFGLGGAIYAILMSFRGLGLVFDDAYLYEATVSCMLLTMGLEMGPYPLNRPKPSKLPLQIFFLGIVAQSCHEKRFKSITPDIWVIARI